MKDETSLKRWWKMNWLDVHNNNMYQLKYFSFDAVIIGDLIAAGLSCYSNVWETFLKNYEISALAVTGLRTFFGEWRVYLFQATSNM